jgi:hypothetical protein
MRRREFMSFVGGAAALSFATSAVMGKVPTLGYLSEEGAGVTVQHRHRNCRNCLRATYFADREMYWLLRLRRFQNAGSDSLAEVVSISLGPAELTK